MRTRMTLNVYGIINVLKEKDLLLEGKAKAAKIAQFAMDKAGAAVEIIKGAWSTFGPIPFVGAALAAAAIAGGIAYLYSQSSKGNDIMSPGDGSSGYGKRTLFGPEGAIQLNNKDTVIAGTDLFKKSDVIGVHRIRFEYLLSSSISSRNCQSCVF